MENKCKRFLSLLLAFVMVLGMFPVGHAHAATTVDGNTINMFVGDEYTFENLEGDYSSLTGEHGAVSINAVFTKEMVKQASGVSATEIESGETYVLYNTAAQKLMNNQWADASVGGGGTDGLGLGSSVAGFQDADCWTITSAPDGGYYVQDMDGKYLSIARGKAQVKDEAVVIDLGFDGTDWTIGEKGEYANDFGGKHTVVAGWSDINDSNSQWHIYKLVNVPVVTTSAVLATELKVDTEYMIVNPNQAKVGNGIKAVENNSGRLIGSTADLNAYNEKYIWTLENLTKIDNTDYYTAQIKGKSGNYMSGNQGVTNAATATIVPGHSTTSEHFINSWGIWFGEVGNPVNSTSSFLNYGANMNMWSFDDGSHWSFYEVTKTAQGTSDVTIKAETVGTTEITIGGTTYTVKVENVPEVHKHDFKGTVTTPATCVDTGVMTYECACGEDTYTEAIPVDSKNHKTTETRPEVKPTLTKEGKTEEVYCTACNTSVSGGDVVAKLTAKSAQPLMSGWTFGTVSLADCEFTVSKNDGSYVNRVVSHGGNYYVKPAANTNAKPQQNAFFGAIALEFQNNGKVRIRGYGQDTGYLHMWNVGEVCADTNLPSWDKCGTPHGDKDNGTDEFYLLKANPDSTFAGVPGYEQVTTRDQLVYDESYLIAAVNKSGVWFVMYPSTEAVSIAKVVDDAVTHTHSFTSEENVDCGVAGTKTETCECGHVHITELPPEPHHGLTHVKAKAPTCVENGNIEYWYCTNCGGAWLDEDCTQNTNLKSVILPAAGEHTYADANCTTPKTCSVCGATEGEALGHTWADANCTTPKTCSVCGATDGEALGHDWNDADCDTPKTCSVCGETEGEALGHDWNDADCDTPKTCSVCGETEGEALGHTWDDADCDTPKTCSVCGATDGEALGHTWADANCTTPKTCSVCGATEGAALGHTKGTPVKENEVAPTLNSTGSYEEVIYCTVCGAEVSRNKVTVPALSGAAARVDGVNYATFDAAVEAAKNGECKTIVLLKEVTITGDTTYDLSGLTVESAGDVFIVTAGTLTLNGGIIKGGTSGVGSWTAVWANGGHVVINGGTYSVGGDSESPDPNHQNDVIYTKNGGSVVINGGTFLYTEGVWTLNENDANRGTITVYGGSFQNWNPANNNSEGAGSSFVAEGYCSTFAEGFWTVNAHNWNDADCTNPKTCSICGATEGEAVGHTKGTPVKENEVAPTLNSEGSYEEVIYCTVCGAEVSRKTETIPALIGVAEIEGVKYATLQDAFDAVKDMETITLLVDVELDTYLNVNNPGVFALDLNGHNIKRPYEIGSGNTGIVAIYVNGEDTCLDIYGEGSVTAELAVWAASGMVVIEGGKFHGYTDTIYTSGTGCIEIWGGEFSAEETTHTQNKYSVLNKKDGSDSEIAVVGGSFIGFNPANNYSEGAGTNFVAEDYCSRENEGVWTVVEGHDWNDADCTNPKTCTVCGATDGEALGHDWNDADCDTPKTCTVCGATDGDALGHAWSATAYENKGENHITTYTCGNDATHTDSKTEAHTYVNGKCVCGAEEIEVVYVAKIGEQGYETLAKAITAANTGDTIVLLADINENVNVSKSVIIDGAEKNYTGTMTIGNSKNVTVQNVNFVKGSIVEAKGNSSGTLTIKNCDFDGVDKSIIYAVTMDTSSKVIVEDCTAKGYDYGFLYIKRMVNTVNVKNATVENVNYGVNVTYGNTVNLENVKMTNVSRGVMTSNYGAKTINLTNCEFSGAKPIFVWGRDGEVAVDTFKFYGTNTLTADEMTQGEYAKFVLPEMNSVLVAPAGLDVITTVEGYAVSYENGAYFVDEPKAPVAQVGEKTFTSIQAAIDAAVEGDVITIIADHELDGTKPVTENTYGYDTLILIEEKNVTIDFNGHTVAVTPACDATTNGSNGVMLESIIFLGKGSKLTLKDSVGNGGFQVNKGTALYSMVYNSKSTLTIENGIYNVAETVIAGALVYADLENTTAFRGGEFTLGNAGIDAESTKPWIFNVYDKNIGNFVEVTGGTYNQDLLMNYGTKKDCEVYIPEGYVLVDNENGTWSVVEGKRVVMIQQTGEKFGTLADAIAAANAGDTIVLLADINENVTVSKSVTIDGAEFNYTGTMKINTNLTVTVKNVDFVAGSIEKDGSKGTLTVKDCTFDAGEKTINYAITARGGSKVTVEGCSASGYNFGFLYIPKSVATVNVKDTVVDGMNYGVSVAYANKVNLENVKMTNMKYGVYTWNFGAKNYSLTNCEISAAAPIATFLKATAVDTFKFYGTNTLDATADWNLGEYLKFVLPAMDSKLVAPAGLDVITTVDGYVVSYENGTYFVDEPKAPVAQVGEQTFTSIQAAVEAAQDGETVVLLTNVELGWNDVITNADGYTTLVDVVGKSITLDLAGHTISVDHQSDADRIYSVICVEDGASLTVTGNGGIDVDTNDAAPKVAYMFWKRGTTGTMVIENGSYHMDNSEDSMVYTNGSEIVTVKGGTFILDAVGTRVNGFPWTFNTAGNNQRNIVVIGGTYNYDITNQYWKYEVNIPEGYACEDNGNGTWSVVEDNSIAQNLQTGEKFETLAEAIAAVKNGETIVMLADCDENVTIKQTAGKSFTIDGDGKTYTGTITVNGNRRSTGAETLTIKNFNFVLNGQWQSSILASKNTYVHNLTIDGCTFTGTDAHEAYGIRLYSAYDVTVKNTTGTKLYDLVYAQTMTEGFTAENIVVTDSGMGFFMPYAKGNVSFKNVQLQTSGAGVGFYNNNVYTATFENCIFDSDSAIWVDHSKTTSNVGKLIFKGGNDFGDGAWLNVAGQGTDVIVDLTGSDLDISKVTFDKTYYGVETVEKVHTITELPSVAAVNGTEYKSIQAAVEAAVDGDVITIIADHELDGTKPVTENTYGYDTLILIEEKNVTIDFNGHTVAVTPACDATTNGSNGVLLESIIFLGKGSVLTLTDSVGNGGFQVNEGTDLYSLIYNSKSTLIIESGIYNVAETVIAGALVYADSENTTAFRGGEFTLGNAGIDAESTKPWIFNVQGKNSGNFVEVTGGTYNQDLLLNYGTMKDCEIYIPEGYILVDNENGTWTVRAGKWIAEIAETGKTFETLAEAIAAVKNGETVVLLDDCAEDVTIKQVADKSFTIDGNGKTYSGTITVDGSRRYNGTETLTIKNVNFVSEEQSHIFIDASNSTYAHNITVDGCSFTGDGSAYGMKLSQVYNITVKNTTGTKLFDLVYGNKAVNGLTVENVEISDSSNGFMLSYVNGTATFKNVTIDAINDGVIIRNNAACTVTFEDCSIDNITYWPTANNAKAVSMIFNDTVNTLDIAGEHTMLTAVLNQPNATITAVEGLNVIPSEELAKSYEVVYENGVYRLSHAIARNEATGKLYMDLSDALAEAADGQTVTLLKETAEDLVLVPAGVTFDLNGNVVTAGNVLSFGIVKDTAANVGGIKISNNTEVAFTKLQPENGGYLPIYDTRYGMYKFFAYELTNADGIKLVGNSVKFGIKLSFENEAAFEVMANTEDSGITMSADVTWTGMNVPNVNFKLDKALTVEYALKKAANPSKNYAITLTIGGLDNLQAGDFIRVTPILTTNTEVGCRINTNEYIKD